MLSWFGRFLGTSIGKKISMALTGLLLIGFLVAHLAGNLTLYADDTGEAFNDYAHLLESNPLLPVAEVVLLVLFLAHIGMGVRLSLQNREARKKGYQQRASMGRKTFASASMLATGILVGVFLVVHIADFRIAKMFAEADYDLAGAVKARLATPVGALIYLVGVGALTVHLSHAFGSALQTLGLNHPKYTPLLSKLGIALAVLLGLGFASFPILIFATGGGGQ